MSKKIYLLTSKQVSGRNGLLLNFKLTANRTRSHGLDYRRYGTGEPKSILDRLKRVGLCRQKGQAVVGKFEFTGGIRRHREEGAEIVPGLRCDRTKDHKSRLFTSRASSADVCRNRRARITASEQ